MPKRFPILSAWATLSAMVLILENASSCSSPARSACWAITTKVPCSIRKVFIRGRSGPSIGPAPHWENSHGDPRQAHRRWDFLGELPRQYQEGDFLFVHGSARNPLNEYVFPEDIYNRRKMEKIFALVPKYAFQRHTHVPGVLSKTSVSSAQRTLTTNTAWACKN